MSQSLISLESAHAHLRLGDDTSLDTLVADYLEMAIGIADDVTNRSFCDEFTSENLPPAIKAAILLILGTLFDNEADTVIGRSVAQMLLTAEKLLLPWRIHPYGDGGSEEETPSNVRYRIVKLPDDNV